ncbi:MAG TPA: hypothetical protein P5277_03640 [Candidatus Paceibacterota bacterium]|nr:hypothetical protein [Candidatus Paceibacterota bacterium]
MKNTFLILSLIGIFVILIINSISEPKQTHISEISDKNLNKQVKITGKIFQIKQAKEYQIISIKDNSAKIEASCKCNISKDNMNKTIEVIGKVNKYQNNFQIYADKIILVRE